MKILYHAFIYLSFVFLCITLYKADYLIIPEIRSAPFLCMSFIFLFSGFIMNALSVKAALNISGLRIGMKESIAAVGLTIFGKYIPGKIWMVFGISSYIATKQNHDFRHLSILSLDIQVISLWTGLFLGFGGVMFVEGLHLWRVLIIGLWVGMTLILFSRFLHIMIIKIYYLLFRREISAFQLHPLQIFRLTPWYLAYWVSWSIGFYLLAKSLIGTEISVFTCLGFPLSATIGIIVIIAPGGLGIREGVLTAFLTFTGFSITEATTIAVATRLWFLAGEGFIFLMGWGLHQKIK